MKKGTNQYRILDVLSPDGTGVGSSCGLIAQALKINEKSVSSQLTQLFQDGYTRREKVNGVYHNWRRARKGARKSPKKNSGVDTLGGLKVMLEQRDTYKASLELIAEALKLSGICK